MYYCTGQVISLIHARGLPAAVIAVGFAVLARVLGSVTDGGAIAGIVAAFVLMLAAGVEGFLPLLTVFLLTAMATRLGWRRKQQIGVAERSSGRTMSQVAANLGAATLCAAPVCWFPQYRGALLAGAMAALAEAAADTVSSEVGQGLGKTAYLIVDLRPVAVGTNGGISVPGTLAGFVAALLVAWVSGWMGVVSWLWATVIAVAGIAGMMIDSVLGATLENGGRMGNDSVNFVSTVFAADIALLVAIVLQRR